MGNYYKPWLSKVDRAPELPDHPLDKIRCTNGHYRYIVACMHNCPHPRYCKEFWAFFERRNELPPDYHNPDGIGERVMRRIVIDCDRCGRKDIEDVYSLYRPEGEGEEFRLPEEELRAMVVSCGYAWEDVGPFAIRVLEELERDREWVHFCRRCFAQSVEWLAKLCQVKPVPALKGSSSAKAKKTNKLAAQEDLSDRAEEKVVPVKGKRKKTKAA